MKYGKITLCYSQITYVCYVRLILLTATVHCTYGVKIILHKIFFYHCCTTPPSCGVGDGNKGCASSCDVGDSVVLLDDLWSDGE